MTDGTDRHDGSGPPRHGPGMRFFADLTGRSVDEAAANPRDTLFRGLEQLASELRDAAEAELTDDPRRREEAGQRTADLRDRLQQHFDEPGGVSATPKERFQQRLQAILGEAVEGLQTLQDG